jgi:hypothetical protein
LDENDGHPVAFDNSKLMNANKIGGVLRNAAHRPVTTSSRASSLYDSSSSSQLGSNGTAGAAAAAGDAPTDGDLVCWVCSNVPLDMFPQSKLPPLHEKAKQVLEGENPPHCLPYDRTKPNGEGDTYGQLVAVPRTGDNSCLLILKGIDSEGFLCFVLLLNLSSHVGCVAPRTYTYATSSMITACPILDCTELPLVRGIVTSTDFERGPELTNYGPFYSGEVCVCNEANFCNVQCGIFRMPPSSASSVRPAPLLMTMLLIAACFDYELSRE